MQFTTAKDVLQKAVQVAERIVGKKESLPVLSCVLFEVGTECVIRATNLEAAIEVHVPGDIGNHGTLAVPVSVLSQTLRSLGGDKITLKEESGNLLVEARGSKTLIKTIAHDEFPSVTSKDSDGIMVERQVLVGALQSVAYAASPSMIRPELGSVYLRIEDGSLISVATDSFRLAEKTITKGMDGECDILIPLKHAQELIHILEHIGDTQVMVVPDDTQLTIKGAGIKYVSRLVDATFPNYREIIPKKFSSEATILKGDLIETLRKARIFAGAEQRVGLHVYPKKKVFDITAQSASIGEMSDSVEAGLIGEDIDINFHVGYLSDALPTIQSDSVILGFSGAGRPLVIRGTSDTSFTYLVMPLNR